MIVVSVVLILVAVVLLVLGLLDGSSVLLISSIAVSLLAAVTLVVGARQAAAARAEGEPLGGELAEEMRVGDEAFDTPAYAGAGARYAHRAAARESTVRGPGRPPGSPAEPATVPAQPGGPDAYGAAPRYGPDPVGYELRPESDSAAEAATGGPEAELDEEDPPDEPAPQAVSPADAAKVARMSTDVLVIDGRPRYHLPGCVHLLGRESEPLPVGEAVELGFTPCGLCEPDKALLTGARRV